MARKPGLPDVDKKALEELARQFPSTARSRRPELPAVEPLPAEPAPPPAAAPAPSAPVPPPLATPFAPLPPLAPATPPPATPVAPPMPAPAAAPPPPPMAAPPAAPAAARAVPPPGAVVPPPSPPPMPRGAPPVEPPAGLGPAARAAMAPPVRPAAPPPTPPAAAVRPLPFPAPETPRAASGKGWHRSTAVRLGVGVVLAFLVGFLVGRPWPPMSDQVAEAVQAARQEVAAEIQQIRAQAAQALLDSEARGNAARAQADRTQAELNALLAMRGLTSRALATAVALHASAEAGRPFNVELAAARQEAGSAIRLAAALDRMAPYAGGVPSFTTLVESFETAAPLALQAGEVVVETSLYWRIWETVVSLYTGGSLTEQAARATGVSAARRDLARGDLAGAVAAIEALDHGARAAMEGWLTGARDRMALDLASDRATAALMTIGPRAVRP